MTLARLLLVVLFVCSASAFAQKHNDSLAGPRRTGEANSSSVEAWQSATQPASLSAEKTPLDRMQIDQFRIDRNAPPFRSEARKFRGFDMDGQLADDTLCYAIRSYVVARDSKGSDSTHPVGYSTCQKASRYRLRTAGGSSASVDR